MEATAIKGQKFKTYMTRKFRTELHQRLKILAAAKSQTVEDTFNQVIESGLAVEEARLRAAAQGNKA